MKTKYKYLILIIGLLISFNVSAQFTITLKKVRADTLSGRNDTIWISDEIGSQVYFRTKDDTLYFKDTSGERTLSFLSQGAVLSNATIYQYEQDSGLVRLSTLQLSIQSDTFFIGGTESYLHLDPSEDVSIFTAEGIKFMTGSDTIKFEDLLIFNDEDTLSTLQEIRDLIAAAVPGSNNEIVFNDNGVLGSNSNFKYNVGGFGDIYTGDNIIIGNVPSGITYDYNVTLVKEGLAYASLGGYNVIIGGRVCNNCSTFGSILIGGYSDGGGSGGWTADDVTASNAVIIGSGAAGVHTDGMFPVYYGYQAGTYLQDGCDVNTIIGAGALKGGVSSNPYTDNVDSTIAIGYMAGYLINSNSFNNIFLGNKSFGGALVTSIYNIGIGNNSGYNSTGYGNIFIGHNAGYNLTSENYRFIIENGQDAGPNLFDFDFEVDTGDINSDVDINGKLKITELTTDTSHINLVIDDNGQLFESVNVYAGMYLDSNDVTTTINTINVWEKVGNMTQSSVFENATYTTDTIWLDFDGIYKIDVDVGGYNLVSGQDYEIGVSISGNDPIIELREVGTFEPGNFHSISFSTNYRLNNSDYLVLKTRDISDTRNIIFRYAHLNIIKLN